MDQWNQKGIKIESLNSKIYPYFGVFTPTNRYYLELFNNVLEEQTTKFKFKKALDIGTGTGVLSFIMKKKGIPIVTGVDINPWAIENAKFNSKKLKLEVDFIQSDGFPKNKEKYDLIVFNPPWISAKQENLMDSSVFDSEFDFINRILDQCDQYLNDGGRVILIFSNVSKLLGFPYEIKYPKLKLVKTKDISGHYSNQDDLFYEVKKNEKIECYVFKKN